MFSLPRERHLPLWFPYVHCRHPPPTPTLRMSIAYHCVVFQCFYLRWHGKGEKNTWWARQFCLISKPKNFSFPLPCVHTSISFTCFCIWHYIERIVHWSAWRFEAFSRFKQEWDEQTEPQSGCLWILSWPEFTMICIFGKFSLILHISYFATENSSSRFPFVYSFHLRS